MVKLLRKTITKLAAVATADDPQEELSKEGDQAPSNSSLKMSIGD